MSQGHTLVLNSDWTPLGFLPLSTLNWQDAVKALYLGTVRVLHEYENWVVSSPTLAYRIPSVVIAREYVKFRRTVAFTDDFVFLRDGYRCQYCGNHFDPGHLTLDHVVPKSHGGKLIWSNTATACSPCNSRRGNNTRIQPRVAPYRPTYQELVSKRRAFPITVPHQTWIQYIGWDENLVRVRPPLGEPGFLPPSEPERALRTLLMSDV